MKTSACYLVAALVLLPRFVLGQAGQSNRSLPSTPQGFLALLAGTWHFDLYSQGYHGPVASGQREMRLLADSMKLTWSETYNTATGAYYQLGAVEHEPSPMILIGRVDRSGNTVVFDVASTDARLARPGIYVRSELRLIDPDHFEWVTSDGRGRGVFNRIGHS